MYLFADGFDLYATTSDPFNGYWDTGGSASYNLVAGRFAGSQAIQFGATTQTLLKTSGQNDAVHHFIFAVQATSALSGTNATTSIELIDGATIQCTIVIRSDGAILLTSGGPTGTTLATYPGAMASANTWFVFEIEVVINSTTGSIAVRRNGNTVNDFSASSLNTRTTANNYANKISIGTFGSPAQTVDDFMWRSDPTSVPWLGDVRCFTRRPATDASVQWTPSGSVVPVTPFPLSSPASYTVNHARYTPFTAPCAGTVGSVTLPFTTASTANFKVALYNSAGGLPTTPIGTSNAVAAPAIGTATFTFASPPSLVQGTSYFMALCGDATSGQYNTSASSSAGLDTAANYATFPVANPASPSSQFAPIFTINITPTGAANAPFVADTVQDAANSYVYSSTNGQADLYNISAVSLSPLTTVAVTTRGYAQKSDAGTRNAAMQLKSGSTTVQSTSTALQTGVWNWLYRTDLTDPATGSAWSAAAVAASQIGPVVTA